MTPAEVVIDVFGGVRATARIVETAPSTVCRWLQPKKRGGTGGFVPQPYFALLMQTAKAQNRVLTLEHLVIGKPGIQTTAKRWVSGQKAMHAAHVASALDPMAWIAHELERV